MTTNFQKRSLKQWHKALLRLTLPFIWILFLLATACTITFLGIPCAIAAFISWVIFGKTYPEYTIIWCVLPMPLGFMYVDWLKEKDVIKP